jgi:hypothetical protein
MTLEQVEKALISVKGFKNIIGLMGGEPTIHPRFKQICELFQKYVPKEQRGLWTNGYNWNEQVLVYDTIIRETFPIENIVYNAHDYKYINQHQPVLIPSGAIIQDEELLIEIIDKCWVHERWSASINPKGAYFCEVAGALDILYDLNVGWKPYSWWWQKDVRHFTDQISACCHRCSMAIPFGKEKQYWGPGNPYTREHYDHFKKDWKPWEFRDFYQNEPGKRYYKDDKDK